MSLRILLDMDEVLVDFIGGALQIHGWDRVRLEAACPPGTWSIIEPMELTEEQFWQPINALGEQFWMGLGPLPWAHQLLRSIRSATSDWHVVSCPSKCASSYTGKARWLKRYFGQGFDRFAITPHKHIFAAPNVLLIDDREETVKRFIAAGGMGATFPTYHNSLYCYASDPLRFLRGALDTPISL